jgi:hypothetical protein
MASKIASALLSECGLPYSHMNIRDVRAVLFKYRLNIRRYLRPAHSGSKGSVDSGVSEMSGIDGLRLEDSNSSADNRGIIRCEYVTPVKKNRL